MTATSPDGVVANGEWITGSGQVVSVVHSPKACEGRPCVIHNLTDHNMRAFPTFFRYGGMPWDIKPPHTERTCPHGIGHPDPDDMAHWISIGDDSMGVHGCDGCCQKSADENWERVVKSEEPTKEEA